MGLLYQHFPDFEQAAKAIPYTVEVYNSLRPPTGIDCLTPVQAHQKEGELSVNGKIIIALNLNKAAFFEKNDHCKSIAALR